MNKNYLPALIEKLSGLDWCFMAGFAVEIYTNGERKAGEDADILISPKHIETFAKRLGCQVQRRRFKKFNFYVNDWGFETIFNNSKIEASSGFPFRRINNESINKVFKNRVLKKYQGINLCVEPIEELIVFKARMLHEKDITDLKLLANQKINFDFLKELAKDWGKSKQILTNLKNLGYKISQN